MQTRWTRTATPRWCCETLHPPGTPFLELTFSHIRRPLWRCPSCAGETPPPDLPPLTAHPVLGPRRRRVSRPLAVDWKARQSGEREPGQEG